VEPSEIDADEIDVDMEDIIFGIFFFCTFFFIIIVVLFCFFIFYFIFILFTLQDLERVGVVPPMSAMIPLGHNQIALPGEMGDGVVVFVHEKTSKVGNHPLVDLTVQYELSNWAPILDFQVTFFFLSYLVHFFRISHLVFRI
jgi:hypothetical protein